MIDKVFPFDQAKAALAYLEKGRAKGKVVVQMRRIAQSYADGQTRWGEIRFKR